MEQVHGRFACVDELHLVANQRAQRGLQIEEPARCGRVVEEDSYVDVAIWALCAACDASEKPRSSRPLAFEARCEQ